MWEPTFLDRNLMFFRGVQNGRRTSLGTGGSRQAPSSATSLLDSLQPVVAASVSPCIVRGVGMISKVLYTPNEPGFQATENSFGLSFLSLP